MPLWIEADGWAAVPLSHAAYLLRPERTPPITVLNDGQSGAGEVLLRRCGTEEGTCRETWVLLCHPGAGLRVNGKFISWGICVLHDRDEIGLPGCEPFYFSSERLVKVQAYPEGREPASCPRCRQVIQPGTAAVLCPGCETWHHQSEELPCWTYAETCALCSRPTALDRGFTWTPEGL